MWSDSKPSLAGKPRKRSFPETSGDNVPPNVPPSVYVWGRELGIMDKLSDVKLRSLVQPGRYIDGGGLTSK